MNGKATFTGCEFEGTIQEPFKMGGPNSASSKEGDRLSFILNQTALSFGEDNPGCVGFGRMPDELKRVLRK